MGRIRSARRNTKLLLALLLASLAWLGVEYDALDRRYSRIKSWIDGAYITTGPSPILRTTLHDVDGEPTWLQLDGPMDQDGPRFLGSHGTVWLTSRTGGLWAPTRRSWSVQFHMNLDFTPNWGVVPPPDLDAFTRSSVLDMARMVRAMDTRGLFMPEDTDIVAAFDRLDIDPIEDHQTSPFLGLRGSRPISDGWPANIRALIALSILLAAGVALMRKWWRAAGSNEGTIR